MPPQNAGSLLINAIARYLYPDGSLRSAASGTHSKKLWEHPRMSQLFLFVHVCLRLLNVQAIISFNDVGNEILRPFTGLLTLGLFYHSSIRLQCSLEKSAGHFRH